MLGVTFPSTIESYRLLKLLGKGAFGHVYEATIRSNPSIHYAIKIIPKKLLRDPVMVHRVRNEVVIHRQLSHPSILELYHFFEDGVRVYLVMELCGAGELYLWIQKQGLLSEDSIRRFFKPIVDGVLYLHSQSIIHRDLKLSNILLTDQFFPKIADFGLAARQNSQNDPEQKTLCGTPNYLAPEIVQRKRYGMAADVWALGCLLYTMAVGYPPFESAQVRETLERVSRAEYQLPSSVNACLRDLISRILVIDPQKRISVVEILKHPFLNPLPVCTKYLKPIKQCVKHGTIELLSNGQICIDFLLEDSVVYIEGARVSTHLRSHPKTTSSLQYPDLPNNIARLYEYAKRFVSLLQGKTPKVVIQDGGVKFQMMINGNARIVTKNSSRADYKADEDELTIQHHGSIRRVSKPMETFMESPWLDVLEEYKRRYQQALKLAEKINPSTVLPIRESANILVGSMLMETMLTLNPMPANSSTANLSFVHKTFLPQVGWCLASAGDQFLLLFMDGQTVLIDGSRNSVGFYDRQAQTTQWFSIDQSLPEYAKRKLVYFPQFVSLLRQGQSHSFVK